MEFPSDIWDTIYIDRQAYDGCFWSRSFNDFKSASGESIYRTVCGIEFPACPPPRIYCGSKIEVPCDRPGETFHAVKPVGGRVASGCIRWEMDPVCASSCNG